MKALIGSTGFVGGVLSNAEDYDVEVHRSDVQSLTGCTFDRVVCAGLPAAKWIANRDAEADLQNMRSLQEVLRTISAKSFVLVSTIDVYPQPLGCNESLSIQGIEHHPYGRHRLQFERFVRERFPHATILRLPALFGPGLKKNVLFDLLHDNCLDIIQPASLFQWYPLARLPIDIARCERAKLPLVNLCPEPISTQELIREFFPDKCVGSRAGARAVYDVRTRYAQDLGGVAGYIMSREQVRAELSGFVEAAS